MELIILGSGGTMPTPRPFCQCEVCKKARKNEKYKRNSSSLFIHDINTVIDCGEDIADSLNKNDVLEVDNLFITHWHPDHTFGLRPIIEANYNFRTGKADKQINIYIPKRVYEILKQRFPVIDYLINTQKTGKLFLIEDGDEISFGKLKIKVVGYRGGESDTYAYLIVEKEKKVLYAPCDTISFDNYKNFNDLDILINECGIFSEATSEIKFNELMRRLREIKPKKIVLTHIENIELKIFGEKYLDKTKKQYPDINFNYAYDGMKIKI